jgi:hypothetical protein
MVRMRMDTEYTMTAHTRKMGLIDCRDWITAEGDTNKNNKITMIIPIARRIKNLPDERSITPENYGFIAINSIGEDRTIHSFS